MNPIKNLSVNFSSALKKSSEYNKISKSELETLKKQATNQGIDYNLNDKISIGLKTQQELGISVGKAYTNPGSLNGQIGASFNF